MGRIVIVKHSGEMMMLTETFEDGFISLTSLDGEQTIYTHESKVRFPGGR